MDKLSPTNNGLSDKELFEQAALHYHANPRPGKISVTPIKALANQRDLALAYSPGVAIPCLEIEKDPKKAALYTCLLYTSPSPRDATLSRMPSSA